MLIHALSALKYLPKEQQNAWKHMLDHYISIDEETDSHIPLSMRGILGAKNQSVINRARQWLIQKLGC